MKDFDITARLFCSMSGVKLFSNCSTDTKTSRLNQLPFETGISMTKANFLLLLRLPFYPENYVERHRALVISALV